MFITIFEGTVIFLAGLCVGSFLNVCVYRFPKEYSIFKPVFSFCPHCKKTINWYDNIPLLSYLVLRGKCRYCGGKIAFRYFLVELITGLVFLFCYMQAGLSLLFVELVVLFSLCILVSFIDIEYRAIPGWICVGGILAGLLINFIRTVFIFQHTDILRIRFLSLPISRSFLGLFLCIGLSYALKLLGDFGLWAYLYLRKKESIEGEKEALGLGDVDFLGMIGVFLGWKLGFLTFFLAPLVAVIYGIYIILFKKSHLIAYLPFLSIAAFISAFWGKDIIRFFFSF